MTRPDGRAPRRARAAILASLAALALAGCTVAAGGGTGGAGGALPSGVIPDLRSVPLPSAAASTAADAVPDAIPPGLAGRTWALPGPRGLVAGITGTPGRLVVPDPERLLATDAGVVATVVSDGTRSTVAIRSVPAGRLVATATLPFDAVSGAFAADELLVGGVEPGALGRDTGLVAIALASGAVRTLLPAALLDAWSGSVFRTVAVSPSGRTIVSAACTGERCALDVVDLAGGARRIVERVDGFPGPVTDEVAIVGDAAFAWVAGIDLATGERRWTREDGEFQHGYARADGTIVQAVARAGRGTFSLEALDPATGVGRVLLARDLADGLVLWPELSSDDVAVLGSGRSWIEGPATGRIVRAAAVELSTGALLPDAVALDLGG